MKEEFAIEVRNLCKKFSKNSDQHKFYGITDLLRDVFTNKRSKALRTDEFYAVHNLSFKVRRGECLALIGRNGCGKTTTLKLVCNILKADYGQIETAGNIQALIALGAGFDRKLNGIENIKNAAVIAGIPKKDLASIVEEVIDFSELEEFIKSPIETYSSGMYARLGFAVAVSLNPEILVVDEILGVGDWAFQNKCFHKIEEIRSSGTTILLVSHSHSRIVQMCERALWLEKGCVVKEGPAKQIVESYVQSLQIEEYSKSTLKAEKSAKRGDHMAASKRLGQEGPYGPIFADFTHIADLHFSLRSESNNKHIYSHDHVTLHYSFTLMRTVENLNVSLNILTKDGTLMTTISTLNGDILKNYKSENVDCTIEIEDLNLNPGPYVIVMPIHEGHAYLYRDIVASFHVLPTEQLHWGKVDFKHKYRVNSV